jgi:hypothetical protein
MQSLLPFLASHDQLASYLTQLLQACVLLALLLAVFVPLEHYFSVRPSAFFQKGWPVNLGWYFINSLAPIFLLGPPAVLLAWIVHAVLPASFTGAAAMRSIRRQHDDAVLLAIRAGFNHPRQFRQLIRRQTRLRPAHPIVEQTFRAVNVEPMNPIPQLWRSIPPILAASQRSIPSPIAASDNSCRLWLTSFDRRANARSSRPPNNPLAIPPLKPWRGPPRELESAPPRFGNPPMSQPAEPLA